MLAHKRNSAKAGRRQLQALVRQAPVVPQALQTQPGHGAAPAGAACAARAASRRAPDDLPCGRNSRADTQKVLSFEALCLTDRA